ncbi:helix-turn-helix domain-containing protein [Piscinibacter sp. HJYY11]|uniref:MerR family transcriptional regulator n=1 Tax=Piscinibacter sp. HJYY11 TaxID=2801333 RepID=UPI00191F9A78|nr:helix-turn-helix domain-containing protein [Piscinibacter sp. HJYY11]MBL0726521.1 helix-turn-helix domain-containing protein [Piscinibacter sp. HJYY11]
MNPSLSLSIGVLAQQTGCTVPTIRYYEEIGLLPIGPRTEAGRRFYGQGAVRRLTFIRRCRDFGFSIEQVRELVGLVDAPDRPCAELRDITAKHLQALRAKLSELQALEASMARFVGNCDAACAGGATVDCTILEDLGGPVPPHAPRACC